MKILFIDNAHPVLKSSLEEDGHECVDGTALTRSYLLTMISGYDGVILRSRIQMDKEMLDAAPQLKFIARAGAGMESIDVRYAESKGIACLNSPAGNRDAVGEHAIGMLLALFNKIPKADREVRNGQWIREGNRGVELEGKTVALIGYGNTGKAFAKKLSGFDANVIAYDKYLLNYSDAFAKAVSLNEIFDEADVLSLHIPLNKETTYLVNNAFITRFRKNIYLVNTARGKCLNTDDLVKNMQSGKVPGACLDTIEYEDTSFEQFTLQKPGEGMPASWHYLVSSYNTVLSPHIAGWTVESNEKIARVLYEEIKNVVSRLS